MTSAREAILGRLRVAQRTARVPEVEPRAPLVTAARSYAECLERFQAELGLLGVELHVEPTPEAVRSRVAAIAQGQRLLSWDFSALPYELGAVLGGAALGTSPPELLAEAELGVTGCDAAIAETGSLMLLSGPGRSRTVSLLPPMHLAVVRAEQLRFSLAECLEQNGERLAAAACTVITGPSRTADIELTLTLGVHGPGKVVVVLGP